MNCHCGESDLHDMIFLCDFNNTCLFEVTCEITVCFFTVSCVFVQPLSDKNLQPSRTVKRSTNSWVFTSWHGWKKCITTRNVGIKYKFSNECKESNVIACTNSRSLSTKDSVLKHATLLSEIFCFLCFQPCRFVSSILVLSNASLHLLTMTSNQSNGHFLQDFLLY